MHVRVKMIEGLTLGTVLVKAGSVLDVPDDVARKLVRFGQAELANKKDPLGRAPGTDGEVNTGRMRDRKS